MKIENVKRYMLLFLCLFWGAMQSKAIPESGAVPGVGSVDEYTTEDRLYLPKSNNFRVKVTPLKDSLRFLYTHDYLLLGAIGGPDPKALVDIEYYDGLGRLVQTIEKGVTPDKKDLVSCIEYDDYGRESNVWLPALWTGDGRYVSSVADLQAAACTLNNDQNPYSYPVYEATPLSRISEKYGPGNNWHANKASVKTNYLTNSGTRGELACARYIIQAGTSPVAQVSYYNTGSLYVTKITDEQGNVSYEFKDARDKLILFRQINENELLDTYYVYDTKGNLYYVLPPELSALKQSTYSQNELDRYGYQYKYDDRNRCIQKMLPGCEVIDYVYDKGDRQVFMRDGLLRGQGKWKFTLQDRVGRVVLTGLCKNSESSVRSIQNSDVYATFAATEGLGIYNYYYLHGAAMFEEPEILSSYYYAEYTVLRSPLFAGADLSYRTGKDPVYDNLYGGEIIGNELAGLVCASYSAVLGSPGSGILTCNYYDYEKRLIQKHSTNLQGGVDSEYYAYTYSGQPLRKRIEYSKAGKTTVIEEYFYAYDHSDRLLTVKHRLNDGPEEILSAFTYDKRGRLWQEVKGNNVVTDFMYNIRSWRTLSASVKFGESLTYDFNGNVSYSSCSGVSYAFTYDNLSRLKSATYKKSNSESEDADYSASYNYDRHGNLLSLKRWGKTTTGYGLIDDLTYSYNGNRLIEIKDASTAVTDASSADFKDRSNVLPEYTYNGNGAVTNDLNKGLRSVQYNCLNLPERLNINMESAESQRTIDINSTGSYDVYQVRGDENGTQMFEFMSQNTEVEWSQAKTGIAGDKGLNFITTSHNEAMEKGMPRLYNKQLQYGYTVRELNHNHPRNTAYSSGSSISERGIPAGKWGDIGFARSITNHRKAKAWNTTTFNIYLPGSRSYISYGPN